MLLRVLTISFGLFLLSGCGFQDWRTAPRDSAGIAPLPEQEKRAVVQVYAARAINWRGWFAVHSWIATKPENAEAYTVYHVMGWQLRRTGSSVVVKPDLPDRYWYGAKPIIIQDLRGDAAEAAIPKIEAAAKTYPYADRYVVWPGPNSNTFISHILREVPEMGVELPPHAIGRDWLTDGRILARSESGTGWQFSLYGLLSLTLGKAEGIEASLLGLTFGADILRPALKLPFIGRIGLADSPPSTP